MGWFNHQPDYVIQYYSQFVSKIRPRKMIQISWNLEVYKLRLRKITTVSREQPVDKFPFELDEHLQVGVPNGS